ncbi:50S ribosomal protein L21 [Phaeocystidibacter luteus]|uniref:Large ribosomal subunit protein bL21 n=1 Tax=Phaeocystidibacter luteus TaxID=911197 RepID=A0A6N6RGW8_9FLAO|nr:50S ribosomal protein L21 [Phaeocystidibacter luteus]KAB2810345.1 50S ribosomal protein L21 [Phaeocystidibacter luteus]
MYAIVEIAGHQYKVQKDQRIYVNRLEGEAGAKVSFDRVLLTDDNGKVEVGAPVIEGVAVKATILEHLKADKVIIFKKKRRKGYKVKNGHRQAITSIQIEGIGKGTAKKAAPKKAEAKTEEAATEKKAAAKKPAAKKTTAKKADSAKAEAKPAAKKPAAKKPAAKKPAAKKADDKKSEE